MNTINNSGKKHFHITYVNNWLEGDIDVDFLTGEYIGEGDFIKDNKPDREGVYTPVETALDEVKKAYIRSNGAINSVKIKSSEGDSVMFYCYPVTTEEEEEEEENA